MRQQVGFVGDEHAPDMQTHMRFAVTFNHIEGFHAGDEQEAEILQHPFRSPMQRSPWLVEEMTQVAIKFFELLFGYVPLLLAPQRPAFAQVIGGGTASSLLLMIFSIPTGSRYSSASALMCSMTSVPGSSRSAG